MAKYIPPKRSIPHAKELILKRIKLEENCIEKPFDTGEIYALQKAALVMDAYEQGYLVERKNGKWDVIPMNDGFAHYTLLKCSECGGLSAHPTNFCRDCGADMRGET